MSPRARRRKRVRKTFRVFCCALVLVATSPRTIIFATPPDQKAKIDSDEIVAKIFASTVKIKATKQVGRAKTVSDGAGVIISADGFILTATHVVDEFQLDRIQVTTVDGDVLPARVVFVDHQYDIALLKVEPSSPLEVAAFADPGTLERGREVAVIGNPLAMGQKIVRGILGEVRNVNWSGTRASLHSISARIVKGNSGGGTFDLATGMFLGINVAQSTVRENEGFMVPVDRLVAILKRKTAIAELVDSQEVEDTLGVRLRPVTLLDNDTFGKGMLVTSVRPGSSAANSGWEVGDVLVGLGSYKTSDLDSVLYVLHDANRTGAEVPCLLARGDSIDKGRIQIASSSAIAASSQMAEPAVAAK